MDVLAKLGQGGCVLGTGTLNNMAPAKMVVLLLRPVNMDYAQTAGSRGLVRHRLEEI